MKKKLGIILGILVIVCIICIIFINKKNDEKKRKEAILRNDNEYFTEHLGIEGTFTYSGNKVSVDNYYIDEKGLKINIAYYNLFHDEKISYSDLIAEYDVFCEGGSNEQYQNLTLFCEYNNGGNHGECGVFRSYVSEYLHKKGYDSVNPSNQELEEAILYATEEFLSNKDNE